MREHNLSYYEAARKYLCENGKERCYISRLVLCDTYS